MTRPLDQVTKRPPYKLGTKVGGFGTIQAVKSGNPRDYLLIKGKVVTWLDELAIKSIIESEEL